MNISISISAATSPATGGHTDITRDERAAAGRAGRYVLTLDGEGPHPAGRGRHRYHQTDPAVARGGRPGDRSDRPTRFRWRLGAIAGGAGHAALGCVATNPALRLGVHAPPSSALRAVDDVVATLPTAGPHDSFWRAVTSPTTVRPVADGDQKGTNSFYAAVGARIRELRTAAGMTQESFGEAAGMNADYVWRIEAGRQNLSLKTIGRVALVLQLPITSIFEGIAPDASVMEPRPSAAKGDVARNPAPRPVSPREA